MLKAKRLTRREHKSSKPALKTDDQLLSLYRQKRDFKTTKEPSGQASIRAADFPRFVIQKHDATRLHYDQRLEIDGVFKSWAVTRGPSLDPRQKRLAVEVEDHPLDYGDFEGTIPKGEYGGGTVMIWDRGFWSPIGSKAPADALRDGELKFIIGGEKMQGSWVLVRMHHDRTGGKKTNWLLIKHHDEWAKSGDIDGLLQLDWSVASGRALDAIREGKNAAPRPFMLATKTKGKADAVWHSRATEKESTKRLSPPVQAPALDLSSRVTARGETVLGVTLSHRDKILWPDENGHAVTKSDLAEYLATVGPWMIPHIMGRPCSLVRAPEGIHGDLFFQRHALAGAQDRITQVQISGERQPYLQIDIAEGLVAMAQMSAVEFHPWNNAAGQPTVPGRLVFDLDPAPDVAFLAVIEAAKEIRDRLARTGLHAFCKTTGGKGLHVVSPLLGAANEGLGWKHAKLFAQTLCQQMAEDSPSRYLIKMTKKLRTGRIFLDYLRNDMMATAVAPLSPRARSGAPISMPLTWRQVRSGLDPMRFTLKSVPPLLAKSDAWRDYDDAGGSLKPAIQGLVGSV